MTAAVVTREPADRTATPSLADPSDACANGTAVVGTAVVVTAVVVVAVTHAGGVLQLEVVQHSFAELDECVQPA